MADKPEHIQILENGGIVEEQVMVVRVDDESIDTFCIMDCSLCGKEDLDTQVEVYVWGEKLGDPAKYVALKVHCSEACIGKRMEAHTNKIEKDILVVYVGV